MRTSIVDLPSLFSLRAVTTSGMNIESSEPKPKYGKAVEGAMRQMVVQVVIGHPRGMG